MNEINQCPFCGYTTPNWINIPTEQKITKAVFCEQCKAYGPRNTDEAKAIAAWNAAGAGWISVEDRLPDPEAYYLAYGQTRSIFNTLRPSGPEMCYFDEDGYWLVGNNYYLENVTHWMPLPNPPSENMEQSNG